MKKFYVFGLVLICLCTVFCCEAKPAKKTDKNKTKTEKVSKKSSKKASKSAMMTDFSAAQSIAKSKNLPIMLVFSGSDWCGWCIKLDREVFSTPVFKKWADKNIVSVLIDSPRKIQLPPELKKQNAELKAKYGVRGFPTVYIVNADGKVIGKTGYVKGGPKKYIANLQKIIAAGK